MTVDRQKFAMRQRTMPDHLANLDKLTPASLRGAKFACVEILDVAQVDARRGTDPRSGEPVFEPAIALQYKEFATRIHWLNKAGVNILCDVFGEDETAWKGQRIPIVVREGVKNPTSGGKNDMLWIANADEWQAIFEQYDEASARFDAATKTAAQPSPAAEAARAASAKRSRKA